MYGQAYVISFQLLPLLCCFSNTDSHPSTYLPEVDAAHFFDVTMPRRDVIALRIILSPVCILTICINGNNIFPSFVRKRKE